MRKLLLSTALISLAALTACGGNDGGIPPLPPSPTGTTGPGPEIALDSTLKGKITFEGTAPVMKALPFAGDPGCAKTGQLYETVVVSDGGLENVIIYVSGGDVAGKKFAANKEQKVLDQHGCHYIPHAIALQNGQELLIKNSDDVAHNVHLWAEVNKAFNEAQAHKGDEKKVKFEKAEMHFPIKCDVHNWMSAFVGVFDNPMNTVSTKGGAFEMKMAPGKYEVTAIHETLGTQTKMVEVTPGGSVDLNFTFKGDGKGN